MSFLSKLGKIIVAGAASAAGIGQLVLPLLGSGKAGQAAVVGLNDLTQIASTIVQIEVALDGKTGAEKFAAAKNLVGPIILTSQIVSGKKIADTVLLQKGIDEVTQGVVDLLNAIHPDAAHT